MKNIAIIFILSILLTSCNDKETHLKKTEVAHDTVTPRKPKTEVVTDLIKFEPHISFSDFEVDVENANTKPDLNSHELGQKFRSAIKEEYENDESLFAGHYSFAYWGCGSPCQMSVIIDKRNGKIYDSPTASVGYKFQKNSRMLIVNPPDSLGYYHKDCAYCKPEIYILNETTKKFEKQP
jgi:hypothetical protein